MPTREKTDGHPVPASINNDLQEVKLRVRKRHDDEKYDPCVSGESTPQHSDKHRNKKRPSTPYQTSIYPISISTYLQDSESGDGSDDAQQKSSRQTSQKDSPRSERAKDNSDDWSTSEGSEHKQHIEKDDTQVHDARKSVHKDDDVDDGKSSKSGKSEREEKDEEKLLDWNEWLNCHSHPFA